MKFTSRLATASAIALLVGAAGASAATLSFTGTGQSIASLANNDLGLGLNGTTVEFISGDLKTALNGLSVVGGPATLTFTYLGYEAGNSNFSTAVGGGVAFVNGSSTVGDQVAFSPVADGLIDFSFATSSPPNAQGEIHNDGTAAPAVSTYAIGYQKISDTSWYVLFDDIAAGDRDFDDIGMRIDIAPVPLPAAGWLLVAGIGGLAAMRRKKKAV